MFGVALGLLVGGFTYIDLSLLVSTGLIFGGLAGATGSVVLAFFLFLLRIAGPARGPR